MKKSKQKTLESKGWKLGCADDFLFQKDEGPCTKCGGSTNAGQHCKECCGWGVTREVKYHKFVPRKAKKARSSNSRT